MLPLCPGVWNRGKILPAQPFDGVEQGSEGSVHGHARLSGEIVPIIQQATAVGLSHIRQAVLWRPAGIGACGRVCHPGMIPARLRGGEKARRAGEVKRGIEKRKGKVCRTAARMKWSEDASESHAARSGIPKLFILHSSLFT